MDIESIDVGGLDVAGGLPDLRRDLHVFVDYVRTREVKRSHRGNMLSRTDAKRLAKLLSDPNAAREVDEEGHSRWIDFVDDIALELGFVHYDTKGEYAGFSSQEPTFPDNWIKYQAKAYEQFLRAKAKDQEVTLLNLLLQRRRGSASEFYSRGVLGRLEGFTSRGSATGVMPHLDFPAARRFLLELLAKCPSGEWLSTASLVEHLKKHHRYFLIPAKPRYQYPQDAQRGRYGNFYESKDRWGSEIDIRESDPKAFERVEGRYVERFLEGIPLVLGYVEVAYARAFPEGVYPPRGCLQGFRVSERLRRALEGRIAEPRVTVTPNFEVHVVAETYPAGVLDRLAPLCERVSEGASLVLKLTKPKVAAARAEAPDLDAASVLRELCGGELPANVAHELDAWSEHGEKFTLYVDCAVLEAEQEMPAADRYTVERVGPGIRLVRSPDKLFGELERRELMPVKVKHGDVEFAPLPKSARTRFPKGPAGREKSREAKPAVSLTRLTRVQLVCPDRELLDKLHGLVLEQQCPVEMDRRNLTLSYAKQYETAVAEAIKQLKSEYTVKIEDISS